MKKIKKNKNNFHWLVSAASVSSYQMWQCSVSQPTSYRPQYRHWWCRCSILENVYSFNSMQLGFIVVVVVVHLEHHFSFLMGIVGKVIAMLVFCSLNECIPDVLPKHNQPYTCIPYKPFILSTFHPCRTHIFRNKITACLLNGQPNECDENGKRSDTST